VSDAVNISVEKFQDLLAENFRLHQLIKFKDDQIRLLNIQIWGPKSEKLSDAQLTLLSLEVVATAQEVEQEAQLPEPEKQLPLPRAKAPRHNHPGRLALPAHLERREEIIPCHPQDCRCDKCGAERPVIGYETKEELACKPAEFFVRVIKREKRGSHCLEEQGVAVAPTPARIVPKSKLSDEVIIEVLAAKFQQHLPVYRQCAILLEDHDIDLSRQTLNQAILAAAQLLVPVVKAQGSELLTGPYLQADETTMPCQTEEKTGKNHQSYMWEYSQPGGPVVFDFQMGRGRIGPEAFLKGFKGKLQCDGYAAYDHLGEGIIYVACMAHIRREFFDASKVAPNDPWPVEILRRIGLLYDIEREARAQNMGPAQRLEVRQQKSRPIMDSLKTRITQMRQERPPGSTLAKACDYALGQWSRMEEYLKDGQIEIDNNWCEGAIRPIALGRKNWLHIGSELAGPKIAAIMSIVETCRRLNIKLREYLREVLPKLGDWPITRVAELTPSAWKTAHKS
jgi:transposase